MNNCKIQKLIYLFLSFPNIYILPIDAGHINHINSFLGNKFPEKYKINEHNSFTNKKNHRLSQLLISTKSPVNINIDGTKKENIDKNLSIEINELFIESKVLSEKNNILYADGEVIVRYKDNVLKADRLVYNKKTKFARAEGNIQLIINNQIFQADNIEYDFIKKEGDFKNVKGLINFESIIPDLDFNSKSIYRDFLATIQRIEKDKVVFTPEKVINWIFSAKEIKVDPFKLSSKKAFLTNDLLDTNQIKIQINDLKVHSSKEKLQLKSKINYFIFQNKVYIPFWFGNRAILRKSENIDNYDFISQNRWNIGYDKLNKDGYFIGRKLNLIKINDDLFLNIEPQFLLQRTLKGKTKSFVQKNYSINSPKVERKISLSDYFALSSSITGKINDWDLAITNELYSFDLNEFANAFRTRAELSKEIKLFNGVFFNRIFGAYRERVWNGSIGESEVYKAYGLQINQANNWKDGSVKRNQTITFGLGNYEAEELNSSAFANSYKGSINYQFNQKVPLYEKRIDSEYIDRSFEYIPKPIRQGFYINSNIAINYSLYEDDNSQQYLGVGIGPEMIIGDYKRKFFDYTHIKIQPFYKFKSGKSIFKFDQVSDKFTMDLNFDQHLVGPLLIETKATINLDKDSNHFGDFINSRIGINFKKRSYSVGVFYQPHNQAGGINFNLNGFK